MTYIRIKGHRCYYCGDVATSGDHFPPQTVDPREGYILPSCMECNLMAGTEYPYDLAERVTHVKARLRDRYWDELKHYERVVALNERINEWNPTAYFGTLEDAEKILEEHEPEPVPEPEIQIKPSQRSIVVICACGNKTFAPSPDGVRCLDCYDAANFTHFWNRQRGPKTYTKNQRKNRKGRQVT